MMEKSSGAGVIAGKSGEVMAADFAYTGTKLAGVNAPLLDFTQSDYDAANRAGKLVVLYFYADWCPICRAEFPKMQSAFNELTTSDVVGFRVNYRDGSTDADEEALAREFGVAYQHTKVFVRGGDLVKKAPDSWEKSRYLSEIASALAQQ
jgi:thiol-disulfide isomerase/thioredoxin